jgi:putative flavoprotein involved in K+ transport
MPEAPSDATRAVEAWLASFDAALTAADIDAAAAHFQAGGFWRDMLAFTWSIETSEGSAAIRAMLTSQLTHVRPHSWRIDGAAKANPEGWVEAWVTFETAAGRGKGHVRLIEGTCWTLLTTLAELDGHPAALGRNRPRGVTLKATRGKQTWAEEAAARRAAIGVTTDPYVMIIGGGQGGLSLAARLKHLGVPALILEKNGRCGDSWRNRYPSLSLHDPVWYDHLPFIPFPPDWPVLTPKDRMGDWLEFYQRVMDLDYWTSTRVRHAAFDAAAQRWTITAEREGREVTLRAAHLVFATGMSGYPHVPTVPGADAFRGAQLHSSAYQGGKPHRGKRAVVIGSNTSAHDVAMDLWEHDCDVTMVQRSGTMVSRQQTVLDHLLGALYSEDALARGIDTETADYISTTWPHRVLEERHKPICKAMRAADQDLHDRLTAAGFLLDFGPDETGIAMKSNREGGGFYIDVGCADLICNGDIKLAHGGIERLTAGAVVLADGTTLPADLVVYATGYRSMNEFVADIVGRDVADRVGRCWGVGSATRKDPGPWEGELRNMWKPTAHEALWFQGGNLMQSRHFSRFLALQLKARMEGVPVHVYRPARGG